MQIVLQEWSLEKEIREDLDRRIIHTGKTDECRSAVVAFLRNSGSTEDYFDKVIEWFDRNAGMSGIRSLNTHVVNDLFDEWIIE